MTLQQLHYTSCEKGLSGHSGFQFCAITPGTPQEILREIELLTVYEPPRDSADSVYGSDIGRCPVNLLYTRSESAEMAIIARVVFAGVDFSNRSGNYFSHTLVTDNLEEDLQPVLPIELWESPFWASHQAGTPDLPALARPPQRGRITRQLISEFLGSELHNTERMAALLAAADAAMTGARQILLIGRDSSAVSYWIAGVTYLLGLGSAGMLTFSTYSHDPRRCRTHVVGTVAAAGPFRADLMANFWLCDLVQGHIAEPPSCPSAVLLARIGVEASAELWEMAVSLSAPRVSSLAAWFPALASAALLLEHHLTPVELESAIAWLAADGGAVDRAALAVRSAIRQPLDRLSLRGQQDLIGLASRLDGDLTTADGALTGQVECAIVEGAMARVDGGESPGVVISLRTDEARLAASGGCSRRLVTVDAGRAIELLAWASAACISPNNEAIRIVGRNLIVAMLLDGGAPGRFDQTAEAWPALRMGMIDKLHTLPTNLQQVLFADPMASIFRAADFAGHPELGEDWLVNAARQGRVGNVAALVQITETRRSRGWVPAIESSLLGRLWPNRGWTAPEAAEAVHALPVEEVMSEPVRAQFGRILRQVPPADNATEAWMTLVSGLASFPVSTLQEHQLEAALELAPCINLLRQEAARRKSVLATVSGLAALYKNAVPEVQCIIDYYLPPLLLRHPRLDIAIGYCPQALLRIFCQYAYGVLTENHDVALAAEIYLAMRVLKYKRDMPRAAYLEHKVLVPALQGWKRREIAAVSAAAELLSRDEGERFKLWYREHMGRRILWQRDRG
jgi:hypothetical protein